MRLDQTTLDTIGFRPVLAPTPDDYFKTNWFTGPHFRTALYQGKAYAAVCTCLATISWGEAQRLVKSMGARLPEPALPTTIDELFPLLEADARFPAFLGFRFEDGVWRRLSDHAPIPNDLLKLPVPPKESQRNVLGGRPNQKYHLISPEATLPAIFFEWPSQAAFLQRKPPLCQETFDFEGKHYGLLRHTLPTALIPSFLELAKYSAPVLKDMDEVKRLLQRIALYNGSIALGCHKYYRQWKWRDGTILDFSATADKSLLRSLSSIGLTALVSRNGHLFMSDYADTILVELP